MDNIKIANNFSFIIFVLEKYNYILYFSIIIINED